MRTSFLTLVATTVLAISASNAVSQNVPPWIDAHVHTSSQFYGPLLELVGSYGVTRIVNLSGGHGDRLRKSLQAADRYAPQIAVCTSPDWRLLNEANFGHMQSLALRKAKTMGAKCLKISKALGLYLKTVDPRGQDVLLSVDSRKLDPIWKTAGDLGMPVFIHTGDPKAFFEPLTPDNERFDELSLHPDWSFHGPSFPSRQALLAARNRIFARHPNTQFIAVHFANNPEDLEAVDQLLERYQNVAVDIAARVPELGRHRAERVRRVFIKHQDRIMFGSDLGFSSQHIMLGSVGKERPEIHDIFEFYARHEAWLGTNEKQMPHPTPIQGNWRIDGIGLPSDVLEKVYWRNALKYIWRSVPERNREKRFLNGVPDMSNYYPQ